MNITNRFLTLSLILLIPLIHVDASELTIDFEKGGKISDYGFNIFNRSSTMNVKINEDAKYSGDYGLYFFSDPVRDQPDTLYSEVNFPIEDNLYIGFAYFADLTNTLFTIRPAPPRF